jgi:protein-histidine pros-kinase
MTSAVLRQHLADALGVEGEAGLAAFLSGLRGEGRGDLAVGLGRLVAAASGVYAQVETAGAARQEAEWLKLALRISGDAPFDWNPAQRTARFSAAWKYQLGFGLDEFPGQVEAWEARVHPDDLALLQERVGAHLAGRAPFIEVDYRLKTKAGDWKWLQLRGQAVTRNEQGQPARLMGVHRDIAALKRWEAELLQAKEGADAANRAKSAFLANMSHEIRTPMNAIIGMTELALDTRLDAEQKEYLSTVQSSAHALLDIVNDILDFSKIEAGKMSIEHVELSLRGTLDETVKSLAFRAQEKGLELIYGVRPDVPDRVYGDPGRLRQILTNLIANAIKFTEKGEVEVGCAVDRPSGGAIHLRFSVRDTGIGIAPDQHREIFEAFAQADTSTTRRFGGTGLGLAICTRLVGLMDGKIWVESQPGAGSTFNFTSRLGLGRESVSTARRPDPGLPLAGKRVLVADDNPAVARHLAAQCEAWGMRPELVLGGSEAVNALRAAAGKGLPFDLALVDAVMPPPDGFAVARASKDQGAGAPRLILLVGMKSQREESARARELGIEYTLVKPFSQSDLLDAMMLALGLSGRYAFEVQTDDIDATLWKAEHGEPGPMQILLVEDNPVNQMLAQRVLEKAGHRVTIASNGQEAVDQFETRRFDAILMDVQMPVMSGFEATEAIRSREMRRSWMASDTAYHTPIIAMTAHAMQGDRERCIEAGMDDYIAKPIQTAQLLKILEGLRSTALQPSENDLSRWFNSSVSGAG